MKYVSYPRKDPPVFFAKHFFHKQPVINPSKYKICFISKKDPPVFFTKHFFHKHPVINLSKYKNVFFTKHHVSQNHVFIHIFK